MDQTSYGRIDADGTVYVKTAEGERVVGSWHAGTVEEGLAHFSRRYADIVTEVDLIETRLGSGAADASHTIARLRQIRESLDTAHVVGDLDGLANRLEKLTEFAEQRAVESRAARESARAEALARKTALVEEAEQIATSATQWKSAGDRLRTILDEWKTIKGVDKRSDAELWKRYSAARDGFTRRRGTHFASLDAQRKQASGQKEELVAEAESLQDSTEWTATANRLKELMTEWKAAPRAAKEVEQRLWERFRAAQDTFFTRRSEVFSARDAEQRQALDKRQALLVSAEAMDVDANPQAAQQRLREIQSQWHDGGRLPRETTGHLDRRLRAVEEKVRTAMESAWRRTTPDDNPLLAQMRDQVAEAQARLERAEASGDVRRIRQAQQSLDVKRKFLELAQRPE
ncbi:MAG TPA: DUF349 domain-containing protein [Micromonosporaceae bacterium]|jgi:hypothetical protein